MLPVSLIPPKPLLAKRSERASKKMEAIAEVKEEVKEVEEEVDEGVKEEVEKEVEEEVKEEVEEEVEKKVEEEVGEGKEMPEQVEVPEITDGGTTLNVVLDDWEHTKTLKDLRQMCASRSLSTYGKKSELVERLMSAA